MEIKLEEITKVEGDNIQINSDKLKTEQKKLKRHYFEQEKLEKVLNHIKLCESIQELKHSEISKMYHFEELKYEMTGYCSFNLCKSNNGVIRLIFTIDEENSCVKIEFISIEHYEDFKRIIK